jgi:hypothetical protein
MNIGFLSRLLLFSLVVAGCGVSTLTPGKTSPGGGNQNNPPPMTGSGAGTTGPSGDTGTMGGGGQATMDPLPPVATGLVVAPEFASTYSIFDLGPLPISEAQGFVVATDDRDALLVSTWFSGSHAAEEGLYRVTVKRDSAGHIYQIGTTAQLVVPSVEALELTNGPGGQIFATTNEVTPTGSQLTFMQFAPALASHFEGTVPIVSEVALNILFVPSPLPGAGGTRFTTVHNDPATMQTLTNWYELGPSYTVGQASFSSANMTVQLDGELGGMAYVPAGSPGFSNPALMMGSGWGVLPSAGLERAWAFGLDASGAPQASQRHAFLQATVATGVPYLNALQFEPTTGDFLFLYGGLHVYEVRGFVPPTIL